MIILSGVLVVLAIALLVAGIVAGNGDSAQVFGVDALYVIYISIAVSAVSALCLLIGVFLRRKELWGTGAATPKRSRKERKKAAKAGKAKERNAAAVKAATAPAVPATAPLALPPDDDVEIPQQQLEVPEDALVFVVRGRKRYHLDTCRQLAGRETEELTYVEAREEGFSPCTACLPDTALAARAAVSVPAAPAEERSSGAAKPAASGATAANGVARDTIGGPARDKTEDTGERTTEDKTEGTAKGATGDAPASGRTAARDTSDPLGGAFPAPEPAPSLSPEPVRDPLADPEPAGDALSALNPTEAFSRRHGRTDLPSAPLDEPAPEPAPADEAAEDPGFPAPSPSTATSLPSAWPAPGPAVPERTPAPEPAPVEDEAPDELEIVPSAPRPRESGDVPQDERPDAPEDDADDAAAEAREEPAGDAGDDTQVRIISGTKRYHRTDCVLIDDIGDEADDLESLPRSEAKSRGCTPCLVCQPDRASV
ncbi:hypothetical protein [Actinomadura parmotrematis]|uniref:Uncharacterized protein n=1 Tax=Actinomadura parmotrematis TaxID=2864039 RepID=A0ABS7FMP4_9ACTN|nr:hypothetical protein [Actinomadura parmotrematis]MBW8481029.1 hypothetical protein [Actinomadura parmotrematis]